jgi:putative NADH-flavin reductase
MRLFVLGATGRTGRELIDLGLARQHRITAFVRSPDKIARRDPALTIVKGDPRDAAGMAEALPGHDAVLSALGPTPGQALTGTTLLRDTASSTLEAMEQTGVARYLVVSSAMLFPRGGPGVAFFRLVARHHVRDVQAMEDRVRQSALEWTFARPPRLVDSPDARYHACEDDMPGGSMSLGTSLSWRAVAAFMLDSVQGRSHVRRVVGLSH